MAWQHSAFMRVHLLWVRAIISTEAVPAAWDLVDRALSQELHVG